MGNFKSLWVWKEGINLAAEIYELTKNGEFSKDYGLIQRAVVSIASNIAEGEERDTNRQKTHFFKIAKGSNAEVYTQLQIAHKIGYIDSETLKNWHYDKKCGLKRKILKNFSSSTVFIVVQRN